MIEANRASSSAKEGEHEHRGVGAGGADVAGGLDPGAVLEADVHDDHVREGPGGDGHGLAGAGRFGAHDHVGGVGQEELDAVADDLVVVDQHDPQRWSAHDRIVPAPPGRLKRSWPVIAAPTRSRKSL